MLTFPEFSCLISSMNPLMSPNPNSFDTKDRALKASRSSNRSPLPRNTMGLPVAATALIAPPPRACPSSFVTMTLPTFTAEWNAWA